MEDITPSATYLHCYTPFQSNNEPHSYLKDYASKQTAAVVDDTIVAYYVAHLVGTATDALPPDLPIINSEVQNIDPFMLWMILLVNNVGHKNSTTNIFLAFYPFNYSPDRRSSISFAHLVAPTDRDLRT